VEDGIFIIDPLCQISANSEETLQSLTRNAGNQNHTKENRNSVTKIHWVKHLDKSQLGGRRVVLSHSSGRFSSVSRIPFSSF
jgi:hypothetical protein